MRHIVILSPYQSFVQKLIGKNAIWLVELMCLAFCFLRRTLCFFYRSLRCLKELYKAVSHFFHTLIKRFWNLLNSCVTYVFGAKFNINAKTQENASNSSKERIWTHIFQNQSMNASTPLSLDIWACPCNPLRQKNVCDCSLLTLLVSVQPSRSSKTAEALAVIVFLNRNECVIFLIHNAHHGRCYLKDHTLMCIE